jgi:Surface antigen variable number repeat
LATSKKTLEGIYDLDGDTLRLCFDHAEDAPRPTKFTVRLGSRQVLLVLKCQTRGRNNFRRPDGSRGFPDFLERPMPVQPPLVLFQQPPPDASAKSKGKARVGNIIIVGNNNTPDDVIRDCLDFYPGQELDKAKLRQGERTLERLKLFVVDPQKGIRPTVKAIDVNDSIYKDVLVTVEEPESHGHGKRSLRQDVNDVRFATLLIEKRLPEIKNGTNRTVLEQQIRELLRDTLKRLDNASDEITKLLLNQDPVQR